MTREEHLAAIVAKCRENLELATKRTPGKWHKVDYAAYNASYIVRGGPKNNQLAQCFNWQDNGPDTKSEDNAAFIAACAGSAEAGWRATIAAIEHAKKCPHCGGCGMTSGWVPSYSNPDNSGGHPESEPCCTHIAQILTAWPVELLS